MPMIYEEWSVERQSTALAVPIEPFGRTRFVKSNEMRTVFPSMYQLTTTDKWVGFLASPP